MKNFFKKLCFTAIAVAVFGTSLAFAGCSDGTKDDANKDNTHSGSTENNNTGGSSENTGNGNTNNGNTNGGSENTGDSLTYVFEAEDTDLSGKVGAGYSGTAAEEGLIAYSTECDASNSRYLTYLYKTGLTIDFEIEASEDVSNVTLALRLSCEMQDITLTSSLYTVQVTTAEGKTVKYTYDAISLKYSGNKGVPAKFQDFVISTKVKLSKGVNTIQLITDNNVVLGGTATATAPLVDCIKLTKPQTSNVVLSMEKTEGNY